MVSWKKPTHTYLEIETLVKTHENKTAGPVRQWKTWAWGNEFLDQQGPKGHNPAPINFMPLASIGPYPIMTSDTPGAVVFMSC